jgi:hypothetical protein
MATQFSCQDDARRDRVQLAAPAVINGIDYLEVGASQRTLFVHFLHPLPGQPGAVPTVGPALLATNLRIEGGVRVSGIRVATVSVADRVLSLEVDQPGDFSTYRLRLVTSVTDSTVPSGFDTRLADVDFSFKVDCPSDFDCGHQGACPTPTLAGPPIDYLAKDYASFRRLMLDRLAVLLPDWDERNPADVGVALVELLAYAADQLSYRQDAVATEAYIGTARRRTSLRRHARLVDYSMHEGCNARTWVCLDVARDLLPPGPDSPVLPAGTMLLTRGEGPTGVQPTDLERILADDPVVFETVHAVPALTVAGNRIEIYTWGDSRCCLPSGATAVTLDITAAAAGLEAGDLLAFEEILGPETGLPADADPSHRQVVRLNRAPVEMEDRLTGRRVLEVSWFAADALAWPLCVWIPPGGTAQASVARANVVLADHGMTRRGTADEPLLSPATVPDQRRYRPVLVDGGLTFRVPYEAAGRQQRPASHELATDPRRATPAVELRGEADRWLPERELIATDRFDPRFVVEMEADLRAFLRFGDDVRGRRPSPETTFDATYRIGNGPTGNIGADAVGRLVLPAGINADDVVRVWNPLAAVGGTEPEVLEDVRLHAGQAFRTQERAVTDADYAAMTNRHPDVQRSAATRRWTGSWHTVFVTTDRRRGAIIDSDFEADVRRSLEPFRLAGHDLEVDEPRFVPLDIALTVCARPGHVRADVEQALLEAFGVSDLADGQQGFFHPDAFTFGQPVYLSRIVARAMSVPGVDWVDIDDTDSKPNRFRRWGQPPRGEIAAGQIDMGRLEIARLDNDPNRPENGRLEFYLRGGL